MAKNALQNLATKPLCDQPCRKQTSQRCRQIGWAIGLVLLCAVGWLWALSVNSFALYGSQYTWVYAWHHLGLDFLHNFDAVHYWLAGKNPYQLVCGAHGPYSYPPMVLFLFSWCGVLTNFQQATWIFIAVIAGISAWGACYAAKNREILGLSHCSAVLASGLMLASFPIMFAMERGNYDVLVLAAIIVAVIMMQEKPSWRADFVIGLMLALATWAKVYPALAIPGLLILKRYRAFTLATVIGLVLLAAFWSQVMQWREVAAAVVGKHHDLTPFSHSLTTYLDVHLFVPGQNSLGKSLALLAAVACTMPFAAALSRQVWRCEQKNKIAYIYLLWLVATATYIMPVAYDYNLFFVPLVLIAAWSWRDPWWVHGLVLIFFTTWQPFRLPIPWEYLFWIKMIGWFVAWACVMQRAKQLNNPVDKGVLAVAPSAASTASTASEA